MLSKDEILGDYQILDLLGQGERGSVYLANHMLQNRKVVLKVPHHQSDEHGLLLEPRIMAALKHPNIVELITVEKKDDTIFMVLEHVDGESLDKLIRRERTLAPSRALEIAMDVCSAIGYAHDRKVIHRNICPANILITSEGVAKLSGFGTSRFLDLERDGFARSTRGSPPYMAPEHFRGRAVFQSDLWSLGVTLYEMLTGTVPFYDPDPAKIAQSFQNTPIVLPHLRNIAVPRALSEVVMKALSLKLEDRYLSVQELLKALKAIKEFTAQETHPVDAAIPAAQFNTASQGQPATTQHRLCRFCYRSLPPTAATCPACGEKTGFYVKVKPANPAPQAVKQGNSFPQAHPGKMDPLGKVVPRDHAAEVVGYRQAAEQGDAAAQFKLGLSYAQGDHVSQDSFEAVKWYMKAAEQGNAQAQQSLGVCYYKGEGVPQDFLQAVKWLWKAAEQEDSFAQRNLGFCYANGYGVSQDYVEAAKWYLKAAEQGNADAQFNLGLLYSHGDGATRDFNEALKWFQKAAEHGSTSAKQYLQVGWKDGGGLSEEFANAMEWYRLAVDQWDADAQKNVGLCFFLGYGVPQDYVEAIKWYRKSAEQGNADAQVNLGGCYDLGLGVAKDFAEAVKWYRMAAEQGNANAQLSVGVSYARGQGVPYDYAEAVKWLKKAAEQGNANAEQCLGVCYDDGLGVTQDHAVAVKWFQKALEHGCKEDQSTLGFGQREGPGSPRLRRS